MMLGEAITPILLECIEPPDIANIERSFRSLRESSFISSPSDEGDITSLGSLVVALGYVLEIFCAVVMIVTKLSSTLPSSFYPSLELT